MGTSQHDTAGESTADYPDELGLAGTPATHDPPDAPSGPVTIRGTEHDRKTDTWTVWIETTDGVIETTDGHIRDVGGG